MCRQCSLECDTYTPFHDQDEASNLRQATDAVCHEMQAAECVDLKVLYTHHVDATGKRSPGGAPKAKRCDCAGHRLGFAPHIEAYRESIELVDECLGQLMEAIKKRKEEENEDWLTFITTDHRGTARSCIPEQHLLWNIGKAIEQ